jgi:hypothetical protein
MSSDLFQTLQQLLGTGYVLPGDESQTQLTDKQGTYVGKALALVRPANTEEVAAVVRACVAHKTPIVVQGGNTGLMGAATPDASGRSVLLLLDRLESGTPDRHRQRHVHRRSRLRAGQGAAGRVDAGRLFPLSLGAEGSCTIGGNLGTNAGGTAGAALRQHARAHTGPGSGHRRRAKSGTACVACARTTPVMRCAISTSAAKARWASSPRRRSSCFRCRPPSPRRCWPSLHRRRGGFLSQARAGFGAGSRRSSCCRTPC